jgi:hypothetical protein
MTAVGRHQTRLLTVALLAGAHGVRVGFEDNVYLRKGRLAQSNAELVEQIATIARAVGRRVASPQEARALLEVQGSRVSTDLREGPQRVPIDPRSTNDRALGAREAPGS